MNTTRRVCKNTIQTNAFNVGIYGFDPYNSVNALEQGNLMVRNFHGPLGSIAYRSQRNWDFLPGLSAAEKIQYYGKVS